MTGLVSLLLVNAFGCTSLDGFGFDAVALEVPGFGVSFCVLLRNSFCMFLTVLVCTGPNGPPTEFLRREFLRLEESDVVDVFFALSVVEVLVDLTLGFRVLIAFLSEGVVGGVDVGGDDILLSALSGCSGAPGVGIFRDSFVEPEEPS